MSRRLFQYAATSDPAVLEAIRRNNAGSQELHQRAIAFAQKYGQADGSYYIGGFGSLDEVMAIGGKKPDAQHGQWKSPGRGKGWLPYKNNPIYKEFETLKFRAETVPGVPALMHGPSNEDFSHKVYWPRPFIHQDTAWVLLSGPVVDSDRNEEYGEQWREVLASEAHAAREAAIAAEKAENAEMAEKTEKATA